MGWAAYLCHHWAYPIGGLVIVCIQYSHNNTYKMWESWSRSRCMIQELISVQCNSPCQSDCRGHFRGWIQQPFSTDTSLNCFLLVQHGLMQPYTDWYRQLLRETLGRLYTWYQEMKKITESDMRAQIGSNIRLWLVAELANCICTIKHLFRVKVQLGNQTNT